MDSFFAGLRMRLVKPVLDPRIVIVDIDEKSIAEIGHFPWNRKIVAHLVSQLTDHYDVQAAGFDIVFAEADNSSGYEVLDKLAAHQLKDVSGFRGQVDALRESLDYDGLLVKALQDKPVVLGYNIADGQRKGMLPAPFFTTDTLNGRTVPAIESNGYLANLERLQKVAATGGIFTAITDADGTLRRSALVMRIGDGYYPTLSLATVAVALNARAISPSFSKNVADMSASERANGGLDKLLMFVGQEKAPLVIPVGENLTDVIEFRGSGGPKGGAFTYVSAADVLAGRVKKDVLDGRIVLVGTTAPGLLDLRPTPVNNEYPGVEVHANLIKSILDERFKLRPDFADGIEGLQVGVVGVLLAIALAVMSPLRSIALAAAVAAGVLGLNYWAYTEQDWVLKMAMTLVLIACVFVLNVAWGYFFEVRKGQALVSRFGEYVAPELVAEMAENPEKYNMDGESRELTVLFVDVRGFTTISEGLTPKALREYINLYLTAMSEDIRDSHRGTLDKYIGDAVMAFWGAVAVADVFRHGRQIQVDVFAQRLRRQAFRDRREAAHVDEQHGQLAALAVHIVFFRVLGHFGDQLGRHVFAEARHQRLALAHLEEITPGDVEHEHAADQHQRHRHFEHPVLLGVGPVVQAQHAGRHGRRQRDRAQRRHHRQRDGQQHADHADLQALDAVGEIRPQLEALVEDGLDQVGVHLDPGIFVVDRRGPQVEQPRRGGADQHDAAVQHVLLDAAGQHVGRRHIGEGAAFRPAAAAEFDDVGEVFADRYHQRRLFLADEHQ